MKTLLVDDTRTEQLVTSTFLKALGHEVVIAGSGAQALQLFQQHQPDLVLLDIVMPEMDGYEVVRQLREQSQNWVPVIFLSGKAEPQDILYGIECGADDYLVKPINKIILDAKMQAMERISRMRKQLIQTQDQLSQANLILEKQVSLDGLTGIANRREFDLHLSRELKRSQRDKQPLVLLLCDIDWFKNYNDYYGHIAGDHCLGKVAQALDRLSLRPGDLACRYGGEEFAMILPNTNLDGGISKAKAILKCIQELAIEHKKSSYDLITISVGISFCEQCQNISPQQLTQISDEALYQAKGKGRNTFHHIEQSSL
ncbi:diguanylate cyclase [Alginatibacterium sediminis]|uniref:diguanylate cyclase n=1 Tax=Alginatibacterium sediminis TaxID=2164068 RepID=A0A420EHT3_9ALTE|nr:diguanylate cyclase [Alginatibacterium sediminis]RKF20217.1 diguanylate cyclase [Alginatibacterium sediminis]